jgi:hypothetical protein
MIHYLSVCWYSGLHSDLETRPPTQHKPRTEQKNIHAPSEIRTRYHCNQTTRNVRRRPHTPTYEVVYSAHCNFPFLHKLAIILLASLPIEGITNLNSLIQTDEGQYSADTQL